ncbi:MAG: type II secretion system inner membrane protein GspF [Nitrospirae bacterium]|nr:type II secretion system inner membrane protein GspF [Nitrospirota bacterium]
MPLFEYRGYREDGKTMSGVVEADTARVARLKLKRDGVYATELREGLLREVRPLLSKGISLPFRRVNIQEVAAITRQLATLLGAGLTVFESLTALIEQVDEARMKKTLTQVRQSVNEGKSLADSLQVFPQIFNLLYVNMVRSGEASGALDSVLLRLAEFLENQVAVQNRVKKAMYYPVFMTAVGTVFIFLIFTFLLPRILTIFEEMEMTLPLMTRVLLTLSRAFSRFWWVAVIAVAAGVESLRRFRRTHRGRLMVDRFLLMLPLFGKILRNLAVARFSRTLSTLLSSGVTILQALEISKPVVNNIILEGAIDEARKRVSEGASLHEPLRQSRLFPPILIHMVAVGERSGALEEMLLKVAQSYELETETKINGLVTLLEPMMIVVMAGVIVFLLLSILLPILQLSQITL